jgi:glycosyltransferase involved in cell wall biosynthesis
MEGTLRMPRKNADNQQLHIAMIGQKRVPSREGGVEIVVWEMAQRLVRMGHLVDCYNRSGYHIHPRDYDTKPGMPGRYDGGVRIITVPTFRNVKLNAIVYSVLASFRVLFTHYDVIHYHAEGPSIMCWLPKLFGRKVVVTIHGLDWQRSKWGHFASRMLRMGEKTAVKNADEIIVLSENLQEYFQKEYGRKTHFIPNGINRGYRLQADLIRTRYGLRGGDYYMSLSRIVPEKGIHYLVEAFRKTKTDKKLLICGGSGGTDEYYHEIEKMAAEDPRIIMTGFIEGEELEELLSNAYCYVLPSDVEGMAISLLEAMSYGNCCLVSDIKENTEVVRDHAVTFRKGDVEDLREKLQMLEDNPDTAASYRDTAADFICGEHSWDEMVEETVKLYREVCSR